nr:hypothetical protein CFP56_51794 [Quercus suber]
MKLNLKIVSLECSKKYSDHFKRLIDEEGFRVGVAISGSWKKLEKEDLKFTGLSRRSEKNSNLIEWNFPMELEFSGLDKRLCFEVQHRGISLSRVSYSLSELHGMAGSALLGLGLKEDQDKGEVKIEIKFSED